VFLVQNVSGAKSFPQETCQKEKVDNKWIWRYNIGIVNNKEHKMFNFSNLESYVERKNSWSKMFGSAELNLSNAADRQKIANSIDAELSPENLTCDGELSRAQVQTRYKALIKVAKELQQLDPSVKFYEFA
jgi:hypothetical protein